MSEYIEAFLMLECQPDMAEEVANMRHRLDAFASGLAKECFEVLRTENAELRKLIQEVAIPALEFTGECCYCGDFTNESLVKLQEAMK